MKHNRRAYVLVVSVLVAALAAVATGQNDQDTIREAGKPRAVTAILGYDPVTAPGKYKDYREVETALRAAGYTVKTNPARGTDEAKYFKVANFRPEEVAPGKEVTLTVWHIPAPKLVGEGAGTVSIRDKLKADWEKYGLSVELIADRKSGTTPAQWGQIHKQEPAPRTLLGPGAKITAHYYVNPAGAQPNEPDEKPAPGPAPVRVRRPDIGDRDNRLTRESIEALTSFPDANFTFKHEFTADQKADRRIIGMLPPLQVPKDTQIVVRYYVYALLVPNLTGLRLEEAKARAKTFSLRVSGPETDDVQVTGQDPAAGTQLPHKDALLPTGFPGPREIRLNTAAAGTTGLPAGTEPPAGEEIPGLTGEPRSTAHGKPAEKSLDLLDILLWVIAIVAVLVLLILLVAELSRRRRPGPRSGRAERMSPADYTGTGSTASRLTSEEIAQVRRLVSSHSAQSLAQLDMSVNELRRALSELTAKVNALEMRTGEMRNQPISSAPVHPWSQPAGQSAYAQPLRPQVTRDPVTAFTEALDKKNLAAFRAAFNPTLVAFMKGSGDAVVRERGERAAVLFEEHMGGNFLVVKHGSHHLLFPPVKADKYQYTDIKQCFNIGERRPTANHKQFDILAVKPGTVTKTAEGWKLDRRGEMTMVI